MVTKWLAMFFLLQFCVVAGESALTRYQRMAEAINEEKPSRHEKLSFRVRAMNEIGDNISSKECQNILVDYLFSHVFIAYEDAALYRAFSKVEPSILNQVIDRYKSTTRSDEDFFKVCVVLERVGGQMDLARQFYLEESKRTPLSREKEAWLRVCYVNRGIDLETNLKQLKLDLLDKSSNLAEEELRLMSKIGCRKYVDKELIAGLVFEINNTKDNPDKADYAAIALATLKSAASEEIAVLEKRAKMSLYPDVSVDNYPDDCDLNSTLFNSMCIAAIDQKQSEQKIKYILHQTGCEYCIDHTSHAVITILCDSLVDKSIRKIIEKNLSNSDPNIIRGALRYIYCLGFECKNTESQLFKLLKSNKDEKVRGLSARALGMVARQDKVSVLERIYETEKSTDVQQEIRHTIQLLKMTPPFTEEGVFYPENRGQSRMALPFITFCFGDS